MARPTFNKQSGELRGLTVGHLRAAMAGCLDEDLVLYNDDGREDMLIDVVCAYATAAHPEGDGHLECRADKAGSRRVLVLET